MLEDAPQSSPLTPEDVQKAIDFQAQHLKVEENLKVAKDKVEAEKKYLEELDARNAQLEAKGEPITAYTKRDGDKFLDELIKDVDEAQGSSDLARWRAGEHVEQHLPEYIETARQEAEADDKHINLGQ